MTWRMVLCAVVYSITQRAMKLRLALDESRKTADSSDVVTPPWFWSYRALKLDKIWEIVKIGSNLGAHIFRSDYAIVTELASK